MMSKVGIAREWRWHRHGSWASERDTFAARNYMRLLAHDYAAVRGWTVALTPPQRQKGSKRG